MAWFQVSYFSECLNRPVPLNVLIPAETVGPNVNPVDGKPFRTLYLLHGYTGDCTDWLLNTQIAELSLQFNLAVVMPSGYNGFYVDTSRFVVRGEEFISRELVAFTRKLFPLSDRREDTVIGGFSMGGVGALYNGSPKRRRIRPCDLPQPACLSGENLQCNGRAQLYRLAAQLL